MTTLQAYGKMRIVTKKLVELPAMAFLALCMSLAFLAFFVLFLPATILLFCGMPEIYNLLTILWKKWFSGLDE